MRRHRLAFAAGACLALVVGWGSAGGARADGASPPQEAATCGNNGTAVHFEDSPSSAARKAKTEHKLVFVLHVSGLFEDPRRT